MSLPVIIPESQLKRFRFFFECCLYEGMTFEGRLYKLVQVYSSEDRTRAFEQGCNFSNNGAAVVSTKDSHSYSLWVDMRMPIAINPVMEICVSSPAESVAA